MLQQLQAKVCAQMDKTSQFPPENSVSGLDAMLKDLFERPEVLYGLVQWLDNKGDCKKAKVLVEELRVDIQTGEGNDARTTMNKLLPLYMKALKVREICGNKVPTASPGGKSSDKKLLGFLIQGCMRPFLEKLCTMYVDIADNGDAYTADKSEDFREIAKRLKSALFVFMNIGNFASHTRGKLSFCQQVGLCGAVAAMAETLPLIFQTCQAVKTGRATKLKGSSMETLLQIDIVPYYKKYLSDGSSKKIEKYASILTHMDMTPKARLCMQGTLCSRDDCVEAHSIVEALRFNPLPLVLKCPVPEACRNDIMHKNKLCLFNHGNFKGGGALRWAKKSVCWNLAGCTNAECLRSHSLAEVCWFNPSFRTEACPQGVNCQWKQNCTNFHEEYYHTKRSSDQNEFIGVAEPILFLERTLKALQKAPVSSPEKSVSTKSGYSALRMLMISLPGSIKYYKRKLQSLQMSDSERAKYSRVLNHMQAVAKARICMKGDQCKQDGGAKRCCESHDITEALPSP
ncbi:hypothetical protein PHMEG_00029155 [Phytophthora megakarya]|uniref:Uncharacterized protein n=1 Tax=Phytophthora megakarya TaxID=4795 RepID=A0A225V479_9STRA|nr:hypothetical protein PHMEG_00029155 [Phytophthora megakarya]